ncbi:MAG: AMP-binding protein [Candidatus Omnitrophica bacterium]|nr:AMP-binding protein [Candidatus Omnitrophota bacterium]
MSEDPVIHKIFYKISEQFQERICLQIKKRSDWERWTYQEVKDLALRIGAFLIREGFKKGDFAAICMENRPEWPIIYLGIMSAGLACVPLDPQLTENEIENLTSDCAAKIIFVSDAVFQAKNIHKINGKMNKIVVLDKDIEEENLIGIMQVGATLPEGTAWPDVFSEDTASLIYTSGTTGKPKGVMLTHKNICSNFQSIDKLKLFTDKDNFISVLPLHHAFPFMVTLITPLFCRARVTYATSLKADELLSLMREAGVSVFAGVPQLFYMFYKRISGEVNKIPFLVKLPFLGMIWILWQIRKLSGINIGKPVLSKIHKPFGQTLKFFISGGAKLNEEAATFLMKFGFTILEGYGLTETSPGVAFNPLKKQKIGSVGRVIPDVEVKIFEPDATGMGEVVIRGPNVMKGYYKRRDETLSVLKDGWFYSGDLGYIDKDGYLYLTGRKKELIVLSSGKKIFPEEIEAYYADSPYIKEVCVIGLGEGESLAAVIVPDSDYCRKKGEVNLNSKIKWELENLSEGIASYKRVKGFVIAKEDIPRTRLGKIKRYEVKSKYLDALKGNKTEAAMEDVPATDEDLSLISSGVGIKIIETLKNQTKLKKHIGLADHLELDLGIDSLGRVELAAGLETALNISIQNELMTRVSTVKELMLEVEKIFSAKEAGVCTIPRGKCQTSWNESLNEEPSIEVIKKINLLPGRIAILSMFIFSGFMRLIFRTVWRLQVFGAENIPKGRKCILCVNHASFLDGFVVASSVPAILRKNLFLIGFKAYFEIPLIKNIVKFIRVIPIDPGTRLMETMQASSYVLRNGKIICIFPEGERSIDGEVKEFKKGVGILAKELNVPLVPVYIEGAYESWPRTKRFPRLHPIKITFGKPFDFEELKKEGLRTGAKDEYQAIALGIRDEVIKLKLEKCNAK